MQHRLPEITEQSPHEDGNDRVNRLLSVTLRPAKVRMGRAIRAAIGEAPMKEFGREALISEVCSGARVPDYLARIVEDPAARRRLAAALLEGDPKVRSYRVFEIEED